MARRWQFSLLVLAGLMVVVVALWDTATTSSSGGGGGRRTEAIAVPGLQDGDDAAPSELAFGDTDELGPGHGDDGANLLRPTTTTTTSTTTTTRPVSSAPTTETGGDITGVVDPGSVPTTPSTASTTGAPEASSSTLDRSPAPGDDGEPDLNTVYYEDFGDGRLDDTSWDVYHAVGHDGWGLRRRSAVTVAPDQAATGGMVLQITARMGSGDEAGQLVSGGMKLLGHSLTEGRYTLRARVDPDANEATSGVVQLWPSSDRWPDGGEINIMETWSNRATRSPVESALHWADGGQHRYVRTTHGTGAEAVSAAEWHVYTLDRTADRVAVSVDGSEPVVLSTSPDRIPQEPMDLTVQLDAFDTPAAPGQQPIMTGEVRLMVDWIRIDVRQP